MTRDDHRSARQFALRALGRRMHTAFEMRSALSKRGFNKDVVQSVETELSRLGYINDLHFAQIWVAGRSAHQLHGRLRLLRDLRQKGVPDDITESVLENSLTEAEEVAIAVKAAEKKMRTLKAAGRAAGAKGRESLYRHLASRGFTNQVIRQAVAGIKFEEDST